MSTAPTVEDKMVIPDRMELMVRASATADAETLAKLMELQIRWEQYEAKKAYTVALQNFQQNAPKILKNKEVAFKDVKYRFAQLDKICDLLIPELGKYGLSHAWKPMPSESGRVRVSCLLSYTSDKYAHTEEAATIEAPPDTTGAKNNVQAVGSTLFYLQRYSLLAALGIVPQGVDDDGRTGESLPDQTVEDYLATIRDASTIDELKVKYEAAKAAANKLSDASAVKQFIDAKDKRYRQLKGMR